MNRRVVITGIGTLNPLANTVDQTWQSLLAGQSGIRTVDFIQAECDERGADSYRCRIGGVVTVDDYSRYHLDNKLLNKMEDFQKYAFCAMHEAAVQSRIPMSHPEEHVIFDEFRGMSSAVSDPYRMGVMLGIGVGGIKVSEEQVTVLNQKGPRRVAPFLIPKLISNLSGAWIGQSIGAKGITSCYVTACASGTNAIGEAFLAIKSNRADIIISGGLEATACRIGFAGFGNMKALTNSNDDPTKASRPFDKRRNGFVMSEGGAILVLEELEHAKRRGVPIIAEVVGYGLTNDAYHITSPDPNGDGAFMAMKQAVESAEITPSDIDYINAHGTSTVAGDRIEALSIKRLFDDKEADYRRTAISSTKSMTGHMLGGAGAFEALVCIKACQNDKIPPTINLDEPDDEMADLDLVPNVAKQKEVRYAMSNSFGFGGHNAVLVFRKYGSD